MAFDPEAYLNNQPQSNSFDPDAYLNNRPQPSAFKKTATKVASKVADFVLPPVGMTMGSAAGALAGAPLGGLGSIPGGIAGGAAGYVAGKNAANLVNEALGLREAQTASPESLARDMMEGATAEVGGRLIGAAAKAVGDLPWSRAGEMLSGTPKVNLERAYRGGFKKTYLDPMPLADAKSAIAAEKGRIAEAMSPEGRVAAKYPSDPVKTIRDVELKMEKGEPISVEEALAAKKATKLAYPPDVAKKGEMRANLAQLNVKMNDVLSEVDPAYKSANDAFAASKLRSQLMMPLRVNKTNPDQFSKLSWAAGGGPLGALSLWLHDPRIIAAALGTGVASSPLTMGLLSSTAGSAARAATPLVGTGIGRRVAGNALEQLFGSGQ